MLKNEILTQLQWHTTIFSVVGKHWLCTEGQCKVSLCSAAAVLLHLKTVSWGTPGACFSEKYSELDSFLCQQTSFQPRKIFCCPWTVNLWDGIASSVCLPKSTSQESEAVCWPGQDKCFLPALDPICFLWLAALLQMKFSMSLALSRLNMQTSLGVVHGEGQHYNWK